MERSADVYADVLDDQGTWQRQLLRIRTDAGHFQGVRDLDYIGTVELVPRRVAGTTAGTDSSDREDAALPQWLVRLKNRMKGYNNA